ARLARQSIPVADRAARRARHVVLGDSFRRAIDASDSRNQLRPGRQLTAFHHGLALRGVAAWIPGGVNLLVESLAPRARGRSPRHTAARQLCRTGPQFARASGAWSLWHSPPRPAVAPRS